LAAYNNIEEEFDYEKHFDKSIFLTDFEKFTSDEQIEKAITIDEEIAQKS